MIISQIFVSSVGTTSRSSIHDHDSGSWNPDEVIIGQIFVSSVGTTSRSTNHAMILIHEAGILMK